MDLSARISALTGHLEAHRALWAERPFDDNVTWTREHPALATWLLARSDDELTRLEAPRIPSLPHTPWATASRALVRLPALPRRSDPPAGRGEHMPPRKWAQIRTFVAVLPELPDHVVDWCAGKSHLGRTLARTRRVRVTALEQQAPLCAAGRILGEVTFVQGDALSPSAGHLLAGRGAVALHACGQLTDALLAHQPVSVAVVPCCCHNQPRSGWSPRAADTRIALPHHALRLATADVCAPADRRRVRAMAFRLGLDLLLREATGEDRYHPVPKLPGPVLSAPFETFARVGAAGAGLDLPPRWDAARAEAAGWARARAVRSLDLVRVQFRRAIELVVWLDRARWLEERGWQVRVGTFCPMRVTPRNVAILATSPTHGSRRGRPGRRA